MMRPQPGGLSSPLLCGLLVVVLLGVQDSVPVAGSKNTCGSSGYTYVAHAWQSTCSIPGTLPVFSDALVALQAAGAAARCARYKNIVPMIDFGGNPFAPAGFGDLANESVPCLAHGNAKLEQCAQHAADTRCDNNVAWCCDAKGAWPLGLLRQPNGSRILKINGPDRDVIMKCYDRGARAGESKNWSRCADRIDVPECAGQLPTTAFGGWEFTLWWDDAMAELYNQADLFFAALAKTGTPLDEIVQDTELLESHYARVVAPKFEVWYPGEQKMVNSTTYPTISDSCARARWLAIQRDEHFPTLLKELTARGFQANTSKPEYLASAMGLYITAPCVGDGNAYAMTDSANQAIFNTVVSERLAAAWASTFLAAARQHYPHIRASNFDMRKKSPDFCIPERADGVADCSVAGGGVVGWQAPSSYPDEFNASLITASLRKHFAFSARHSYNLTAFNMMRWLVLHRRGNILADPTVPMKPWIFPKSVCYGGHTCPLITKNGQTYYEELLFHMALAGSRGFLLFNPFFDYVSVPEGPRVTMQDYSILSRVLNELTTVVGCEGATWISDRSMRFEDSFLLSGMSLTPALRAWRLTLKRSAPLVDPFQS
eukprot:COSAG05_NODE_3467_length_2041_cov_1.549434_1_plen_600_part_01